MYQKRKRGARMKELMLILGLVLIFAMNAFSTEIASLDQPTATMEASK